MSVLTGKELRIVGFLCNWCSYGGADTAGVARFTQPTDLRIIRVPCSGRVNPLFPAESPCFPAPTGCSCPAVTRVTATIRKATTTPAAASKR